MSDKKFENLVCDKLTINYNKVDKVEPHIKTRLIENLKFDVGVDVDLKAEEVSNFLNNYFNATEEVDICEINLITKLEPDGSFKEYPKIRYGVK